MKRFLLLTVAMMLSGSIVHAMEKVWLSTSPVGSSQAVVPLCRSKTGILHGVCTNFGVAAASVTVVNSTFTIYDPIAKIVGPISTLVADQCKYYDISLSTGGMGYIKPNAALITILYDCY